MRVIIAGGGGIGMEVARMLAHRDRNEIVLIEADEKRCREVSEALDALVLHGDATHPALLEKAGLSQADALVAVTGSDAINTVIAMLAHRARVKTIVVKLDNVDLRAACLEIGLSEIIAPTLASASRILSVLYGFHRLDFSLVTRGGLRLVELGVEAAVGKKLSAVALADDALVVAILRGEQTLLARGPSKLEEGDTLLVLVESDDAIEKARAQLEGV